MFQVTVSEDNAEYFKKKVVYQSSFSRKFFVVAAIKFDGSFSIWLKEVLP